MAATFDRSIYNQGLETRVQESSDRQAHSNFRTIFNQSLIAGVSMFRPKAGHHTVDIIPFFAGTNYPTEQKIEPGSLQYILDVYVHMGIGPGDSYVCLKQYGLPCPLCMFLAEQKAVPGQTKEFLDKLGDMKAKRRGIYYAVVLDSPEEEQKGLQIWNSPHYKVERLLVEQAQIITTGVGGIKIGGYVNFPHPDTGKSFYFKVDGQGKAVDYVGHKLVERGHKVSDVVLQKAAEKPLDSLVVVATPEELTQVINGIRNLAMAPPAAPTGYVPELGRQAPQQAALLPQEAPPLPAAEMEPQADVPPASEPVVTDGSEKCPAAGSGGTFGRTVERFTECSKCSLYDECGQEFDTYRAEQRQQRKQS